MYITYAIAFRKFVHTFSQKCPEMVIFSALENLLEYSSDMVLYSSHTPHSDWMFLEWSEMHWLYLHGTRTDHFVSFLDHRELVETAIWCRHSKLIWASFCRPNIDEKDLSWPEKRFVQKVIQFLIMFLHVIYLHSSRTSWRGYPRTQPANCCRPNLQLF